MTTARRERDAFYRRAGTPPGAGLLASRLAPDGDMRSDAIALDPVPAGPDDPHDPHRLFLAEA